MVNGKALIALSEMEKLLSELREMRLLMDMSLITIALEIGIL